MNYFNAGELAQNIQFLEQMQGVCRTLIAVADQLDEATHQPHPRRLNEQNFGKAISILKITKVGCQRAGFTSAADKIQASIIDFEKKKQWLDASAVGAELRNVLEAIRSELNKRQFLQISLDRMAYLDKPALFGDAVAQAFPSAKDEIVNAGNALAVELPDAAIFHLMRTAEVGLRAVAWDRRVKLSKKIPFDLATWEDIIKELEKEEQKIQNYKKTAAREAQFQFYHGAIQELRRFKNLWRNPSMHSRGVYDRDQAHSAMEHVKAFMQILASKISEVKRTPVIWKRV